MTKEEAVRQFVETRFDPIPTQWVQVIAERYEEYHQFPMWGTMWQVDRYMGEQLYNHSRIMHADATDVEHDAIQDQSIRKQAEDASGSNSLSEILGNYINEEMAGERCILDCSGDTTPVFLYEIDGTYLIGIHGAGWNFYEGVWDMLYDLLGINWHEEQASKPCFALYI